MAETVLSAVLSIYIYIFIYPISMANMETTLNSRTELVSKCRHRNKYRLANSYLPPRILPPVIHTASCTHNTIVNTM